MKNQLVSLNDDNNNALTAYCFLSALSENQNDLFSNVYLPMCKRALSQFSLQGNTGGSSADIKQQILLEYGIDIPERVVQKLLKGVEDQLSKRVKAELEFKIFDHGKVFQIGKYTFSDVDEKFKKGRRNANLIQQAFESFLDTEVYENEKVGSFTDFLNKNKNKLTNYFKGVPTNENEEIDVTYLPHVKFLDSISKSDHDLYKIAESIFLGSIVAGFLESGIELGAKSSNGEVYFVDTPIILSALDLNKEVETKPAQELLKLILDSGGMLKALSITIEECQGILNRAYQDYNNRTPTSDVNEACLRTGRKRADLAVLSNLLTEKIKNELHIDFEYFPDALAERLRKSEDITELRNLRVNKGSATHDVLAYSFIREKRGKVVSVHQKTNMWFLTSNRGLYDFVSSKRVGSVSEIALSDTLTSLLWLKDPNKNVAKIKSIGLAELMASTVAEEVVGPDLINEFAEQIKRTNAVPQDEYQILLKAMAHESARNIERLVKLGIKDPNKQKLEAQRLVEKERARRNVDFENTKNAEKKISDISNDNLLLDEKIHGLKAAFEFEQREKAEQDKAAQLNALREKREIFVGEQISKWRQKSKIRAFVIVLLTLMLGLLLYAYARGDMNLVQDIVDANTNVFTKFIFSVIVILLNVWVVADWYNKSNNHSNINAFKSSIEFPDHLKLN